MWSARRNPGETSSESTKPFSDTPQEAGMFESTSCWTSSQLHVDIEKASSRPAKTGQETTTRHGSLQTTSSHGLKCSQVLAWTKCASKCIGYAHRTASAAKAPSTRAHGAEFCSLPGAHPVTRGTYLSGHAHILAVLDSLEPVTKKASMHSKSTVSKEGFIAL